MMTIGEMMSEALEDLESALSPSPDRPTHEVRWRGRLFPCVISTERRGEQLQVGGYVAEVQMTLFIRKALLEPMHTSDSGSLTSDTAEITSDNATPPPQPNKNVELVSRNRKYCVAQVRLDGSEAFYALDLVDPYHP